MATSVSSLQSRVIEWLRFPLAAAVVLLHAGERAVGGVYDADFSGTLRIVLSQGICRIAVPVFFFFSGFLFFTGLKTWDKQVWTNKMKKRVRTLLLPYILWNIMALLAGFAYGWLRSRVNPEVVPLSLLETLQRNGWLNIFWASTFSCPIDYPLWFIRDLILYVAVTPVVFFLVRKCGIWGVAALFIAFGLTGSRDLEGLFFFILGAYFQLSGTDFLQVFDRFKWPAYLLSLVGIVLIAYTWYTPEVFKYVKYLFVFFGTVSVINLTDVLVERGQAKAHPFLTASSFFVFASHGILILHDFAQYITMRILPFDSVAGKCASLFVQAALAIGICLGLYALMKKWTPKFLGVLTGDRA